MRDTVAPDLESVGAIADNFIIPVFDRLVEQGSAMAERVTGQFEDMVAFLNSWGETVKSRSTS